MASDDSLAKLCEALFSHVPLLIERDPREAQEALHAAGYRMARQPNGRPMLAIPVGPDFIAIVVDPGQPLKLKLMGAGAADLFDAFVASIERQGFEKSADSPRPGMQITTLSATSPGPLLTISVTRSLASHTVLLAVVVPSASATRRLAS